MRAYLYYHEMWFPIPPGDLVRIGSATECEIRIPQDPLVSRRHCSISYVDRKLTVVDLRSSNGTVINGSAINGHPVELADGDLIQIGSTQMKVALREK